MPTPDVTPSKATPKRGGVARQPAKRARRLRTESWTISEDKALHAATAVAIPGPEDLELEAEESEEEMEEEEEKQEDQKLELKAEEVQEEKEAKEEETKKGMNETDVTEKSFLDESLHLVLEDEEPLEEVKDVKKEEEKAHEDVKKEEEVVKEEGEEYEMKIPASDSMPELSKVCEQPEEDPNGSNLSVPQLTPVARETEEEPTKTGSAEDVERDVTKSVMADCKAAEIHDDVVVLATWEVNEEEEEAETDLDVTGATVDSDDVMKTDAASKLKELTGGAVEPCFDADILSDVADLLDDINTAVELMERQAEEMAEAEEEIKQEEETKEDGAKEAASEKPAEDREKYVAAGLFVRRVRFARLTLVLQGTTCSLPKLHSDYTDTYNTRAHNTYANTHTHTHTYTHRALPASHRLHLTPPAPRITAGSSPGRARTAASPAPAAST